MINGSVAQNGDGTYTFSPGDLHSALAGFVKVIATDEHGAEAYDSVRMAIPARNQPPSIYPQIEAYNQTSGAITYNPNLSDGDYGDTPTYTFTQPAHRDTRRQDRLHP